MMSERQLYQIRACGKPSAASRQWRVTEGAGGACETDSHVHMELMGGQCHVTIIVQTREDSSRRLPLSNQSARHVFFSLSSCLRLVTVRIGVQGSAMEKGRSLDTQDIVEEVRSDGRDLSISDSLE